MACTTGIGNDRPPSNHEYQDTLEFFLCRACRHLTNEQLANIVRHDQSRFCSTTNHLMEWYRKHLEEDYIYETGHQHRPDAETTKHEIKRLTNANANRRGDVYPY